MEYIGIQKKNGGVVEALQQAILSGQIPAGTEMTQNELAESLGVSRMPVREALMILEYQGLIIRLPNNRIKAADLTEETLRQILALGAQLERQAMRALPQDAMLPAGRPPAPGGPPCHIRCIASCWRASRRPTLPLP